MSKFVETYNTLKQRLAPYREIILFMVVLLASNYLWKYTVIGEETGGRVTWFGLDITAPFDIMAEHIACVSAWITSLFRPTVHYLPPYVIRWDSGSAVKIVWACTAIKQSFIWLCLIAAAQGSWRRKAWFIPLGWLCIYAFNILRITIIGFFIEFHPDWFDLLHTYIFKYLFYGMMFLLWVWWEEKISIKDTCQ